MCAFQCATVICWCSIWFPQSPFCWHPHLRQSPLCKRRRRLLCLIPGPAWDTHPILNFQDLSKTPLMISQYSGRELDWLTKHITKQFGTERRPEIRPIHVKAEVQELSLYSVGLNGRKSVTFKDLTFISCTKICTGR